MRASTFHKEEKRFCKVLKLAENSFFRYNERKIRRRGHMLEIGICLLLIGIQLFLYLMFGVTGEKFLKLRLNNGLRLLLGVFLYHGLFQIVALPLIMTKGRLSVLTLIWGCIVVLEAAFFLLVMRKDREGLLSFLRKGKKWSWIMAGMLVLILMQMYYIVTSEYLGWDTSFYVGTMATSVRRNSMYLYNGETGNPYTRIPFRYALSSFYMNGSVWCQITGIPAILYAKIVQGGILCLLSNLTIFELGRFLFSGKKYEGVIKKERVGDCAAAMVMMVIVLHVFWNSMYSSSDFLMNRALEAKSYCGNIVLPFLLLMAVMLWRREEDREARVCLLVAMWSCVAISMSCLVIVPAMVGLLLLPLIFRKKEGRWFQIKWIGWYLAGVLPNFMYLFLYLLDKLKIIGIEV